MEYNWESMNDMIQKETAWISQRAVELTTHSNESQAHCVKVSQLSF